MTMWPKLDEEKAFTIQTHPWRNTRQEPWPPKHKLRVGDQSFHHDEMRKTIKKYVKKKNWVFPKQPVHFITDLHADADALYKSLIGADMLLKKGPKDSAFKLTKKGKTETVIIGGDCFDKGPSNLRLLDAIKLLKDAGMHLIILAGNHDIRTYAGLAIGEDRPVEAEHMFVRMGRKTIPLFKEIYFKYLHGNVDESKLLSKAEVERRLFPSEKWFETYAQRMEGLIPPLKIAKEANRIKEKIQEVRTYLKRTGFSHGMLYATVEKAYDLLVNPTGEYGWFFNEIKIAHQEGSFLFVHAGLDDFSADWISQVGVEGLNEKFRKLMRENPFELYHGHIGNVFRTKYRDTDFPYSERSSKKLNSIGVHAFVHGHRNTVNGHKMILRKGMLNIECDTSLDRKTRRVEGMCGFGASWLTLYPNGTLEAYSTDYPATKWFDVHELGGTTASKLPKKAKKKKRTANELVLESSKINVAVEHSPEMVKSVLEALVADLDKQSLHIKGNDKELHAKLPQTVKLEIYGSQKEKGGELHLSLKWEE